MKKGLAALALLLLLLPCPVHAEDALSFPSDTAGWNLETFQRESHYAHDAEALYLDGTWYASWTNDTGIYVSDDLRSWQWAGARPTGWYSENDQQWLNWAPCFVELRKPYVGSDGISYRYALFDSLSEWGHQEARIRCFVTNELAAPTASSSNLKRYYYVGDVMASGQYAMDTAENPIASYEQETGEGPARYYRVEGYDAAYSPTVANGWNAIDPDVLYDAEGRLWMVFGAWHGGIFITELDQDTLMPVSNRAEDYIRIGMHLFDQCFEGCNILYHNGCYYMTVAYGDVSKTYNIRLARSESITGPYLDYNGIPMTEADGSVGTKLAGPYAFEGNIGFQGQGHCAWVHNPDTDEYFLLSNARVADTLTSKLMVRSVYFLSNGWPVLSPEMATADTVRSLRDEEGHALQAPAAAPSLQAIPEELIPGEYEIIVFERLKAQLPKQAASKRIALTPEGVISGAYTGTWTMQGENTVLLTLDGRDAEMIVTVGYDWERAQNGILVLSGLTAPGAAEDRLAGTAIWMKQVPPNAD